MTRQVRIPETVCAEAEKLKDERDFPSLGEALRHMCQEGGYNV